LKRKGGHGWNLRCAHGRCNARQSMFPFASPLFWQAAQVIILICPIVNAHLAMDCIHPFTTCIST
jgi:hypothetical protein